MTPADAIPVLFTHYGDQWIRGSERVLLDLLAHLDPALVRPIVWTNGEELAEATRAMGLPTFLTRFAYYLDTGSPPPDPLRYFSFVREGLSLVRRYQVRVLHANSAAPTQWLLPVAKLARVKLLVHLHSLYLRRSRAVLGLRWADRLVGVAGPVLAGPRADGVPERKLLVIHNGIDTDRLHRAAAADLRAELGLPDGALVIGTVGSLIARKGHDLALRALARQEAAVHLCIAGDGPDRAALQALADTLGIAPRVHFLGYRPDPAPLYRAADLILLASRGEALPLVLLEAGSFALPVVATDVGGVREMVSDGETGLVVPPDDIPALAAALTRLIGSAGERRRQGEAARARVAQAFSVARMAARFQDLYATLAGG